MKNILIISLQFRVSHIAHLVASYRQMQELGYVPQLLVHPDLVPFLPAGLDVCTADNMVMQPDIAIFWFPAIKNVRLMLKLKRKYNTRIIYVLHEPIEALKVYRDAGLSVAEICGVYGRFAVIQLFLVLSDYVILPSQKAFRLYENSWSRHIARHYSYLPLLFSDESEGILSRDRKYFSYIGTIASDHAYVEFIKFIKRVAYDTRFPNDILFMIATRNTVNRDEILETMIVNGRLKVIDGHSLTDSEINNCYAESIVVWNAYHRTTQSGVLAKASMFGTPALVLRKNLSEFSIEGENVVCCNDNTDYEDILSALRTLISDYDTYSVNSRKIFEKFFNYKIHNKSMSLILRGLAYKSGGVIPDIQPIAFDEIERREAA